MFTRDTSKPLPQVVPSYGITPSATPRRRRRACSVPSSATPSHCSSLTGSGATTPYEGDLEPSHSRVWQRVMMASLERTGQDHQETHVPRGYRIRNTFLEVDESDQESSDCDSASARSLASSGLLQCALAHSPQTSQPPGCWAQTSHEVTVTATSGRSVPFTQATEGSQWEQLMMVMTDVAGVRVARVWPKSRCRMRGKQLAEELLVAQACSFEEREAAARSFLQATSAEATLYVYACVVFRKLNAEAELRFRSQ